MSSGVSVGGQWELLHHLHQERMTNGFTSRFQADGSKFRLLRFKLVLTGQTIGLSLGPLSVGYGAVVKHKHDGTGNRTNFQGNVNTLIALINRGTGGAEGYIMPRKVPVPGWLICMNGFSAISNTPWTGAESDYWSFDGRVMVQKNGTPANDWAFDFGFGSYGGEVGAVSFLVEGLRGI